MTDGPSETDVATFKALAQGMGEAWNRADGAGFATAFTDDANFVNILGMSAVTREAIGLGHQQIFDTIYKGSTASFSVVMSRELGEGVVLGHIAAIMEAPGGPLPGVNHALATAVFTRGAAGWRIAAFHNTLVKPPPG